jgi:hypothetical protein
MKKIGLTIGVVMIAALVLTSTEADAQLKNRRGNRTPVYAGMDADGMTMSTYDKRIPLPRTLKMAAHGNPYTPERIYTYSNSGVLAQRTHSWNQGEAADLGMATTKTGVGDSQPLWWFLRLQVTSQVTHGALARFAQLRFIISSADKAQE